MKAISDITSAAGTKEIGSDTANTSHDTFVDHIYASADEAARWELDRLYLEEGIVPSCKAGCFYCCGQHILTNVAEARALANFVKHQFTRDETEALELRTRQWHDWDNFRIDQQRGVSSGPQPSYPQHLYCPLLVNGQCSAYPMRPLVCRTHFVCSEPSACRFSGKARSKKNKPVALATVIEATQSFSALVKDQIEKTGMNFNATIMLLPHWLAIEMNWDFALTL